MREVSTLAEAARCLLDGVGVSQKRLPSYRSAPNRRKLHPGPSCGILAWRCDRGTLRRLGLGRFASNLDPQHRPTDSYELVVLR